MWISRYIAKILTALLLSTALSAMECERVEPCQDILKLFIRDAKLHELPRYFLVSKSWLQLAEDENFWTEMAHKYFGENADKFKVENGSWKTSIKNHVQCVSNLRNLDSWQESDIANALNQNNYPIIVNHLSMHLDINLIEIASPKICDVVELISACTACFAVNRTADFFERTEICESAGTEVMAVLTAAGNIPFAAATTKVSALCGIDATQFTQREKDLQYLVLLAYLSSEEYLEEYFCRAFEGAKEDLESDRWQFTVGCPLTQGVLDKMRQKKWRCLSQDNWMLFGSIVDRLESELGR